MAKRWDDSLLETDSIALKEIDKILSTLKREDIYFLYFLLRNLQKVKGMFELIRNYKV
jgi:hypothetical protein